MPSTWRCLPLGSLSRVDESVWPDVFFEIVRPLIGNMRDVRRYAAAICVFVNPKVDHLDHRKVDHPYYLLAGCSRRLLLSLNR